MTGPSSHPSTTTSPFSFGAAAASPCTPVQSVVSARTSPVSPLSPVLFTCTVFRPSSVPWVVSRVPSRSCMATPWCGSSVAVASVRGWPSLRCSEVNVWMDPSPSPKRVVRPWWTTTWPA
ncbi:hypothetical protein ACFFX0_09765 [Citricoccus parietis]|uniref:Uncharacterized protein n=1 Tax=Citricoccus parietis TaxID=592307 RepID=A0ABV5FXQ7_9MICC